jgi:hypothetical protein
MMTGSRVICKSELLLTQINRYESMLYRAIKRSLVPSSKDSPIVIDDSDDEVIETANNYEGDLGKSIRYSTLESSKTTPSKKNTREESSKVPNGLSNGGPGNTFLRERAQLERERLERQKRLRVQGKIPLEEPPAKRQRSTSAEEKQDVKGKKPEVVFSGFASLPKTTNASRFWTGEIRQSANYHVDPKSETRPNFRLSDILGAVSFLIASRVLLTELLSDRRATNGDSFVLFYGYFLDLFDVSSACPSYSDTAA